MKKIRKTMVVLVIAALVLSLFPAVALAADNWTDGLSANAGYGFSGGDGSSGSPYLISSSTDQTDISQLAVNVNSGIDYSGCYFKLNDYEIDLSAKEWTPIGTPSHPFSGSFDGSFGGSPSSISGLTINDSSGSYLGLFGYTSGADIINLFVDGNITGNSFAGLIAGQADDGTDIHDCAAVGTVTVTDVVAGGLVGNYGNSLTSIDGCATIVNVSGNRFIGGLIGYSSCAHVNDSIAYGTVSGTGDFSNDVGGFVGSADSTEFTQCSAMADVSAAGDVGGFAGGSYSNSVKCTFTDCFARGSVISTYGDYGWAAGSFIGDITDSDFIRCYGSGIVGFTAASGSYIGGFGGYLYDFGSTSSFTNCYYDTTKNDFEALGEDEGGSSAKTGITGLATADMQGDEVLNEGKPLNGLVGSGGVWYATLYGYPDFDPEPIIVMVTFFYRGGTPVASQIYSVGSQLIEPTAPTWTGYDFGGWYVDAALTTPVDFDTDTVTGDNTIYAKWTAINYTVSFNSNGGSDVASQTVAYGNKVTKPADPTKSGYTFDGWYADEGLSDAWDFSADTVTGATTLYAKWTAVPLSITPTEKTIYTSGRTTLTPSQTGGTWQYDSAYVKLEQNADGSATITGIKVGTTTVSYTVGGTTVSAVITILEATLPETGQDYTLPIVLGGLGAAGLILLISVQFLKNKKA